MGQRQPFALAEPAVAGSSGGSIDDEEALAAGGVGVELYEFRETLLICHDPLNAKRAPRHQKGQGGPRPLYIAVRRELLGKLLQLQADTDLSILSEEEISSASL